MEKPRLGLRHRLSRSNGQSMIEFALILPICMLVVLGVVELGYGLLDAHVVTKLAREGSNLISRNTSLQDAANAMRAMASRPVNFTSGSKAIFSVIKSGTTTGTNNFNKAVLYQRYEFGSLTATSTLTTRGSGSFGPGPEYQAVNSDGDVNLQVTNLPGGMVLPSGGMLYVTEIYSTHPLITPLDRFGVTVPRTLYSIAYF